MVEVFDFLDLMGFEVVRHSSYSCSEVVEADRKDCDIILALGAIVVAYFDMD